RVAAAQPNAGHRALVAMERRSADFLLITQNVDGLHRAAGSRRLVELHGNIARVRCSRRCGTVDQWSVHAPDEPPRCPTCGAFLGPDVVWFEESLPVAAIDAAECAARECDAFLVVGTSTEVYPAAALPSYALQAGAMVVEINPQPTPLSDRADHVLRGP